MDALRPDVLLPDIHMAAHRLSCTDTPTERQGDRETGRHTDAQTHRHTDTDTGRRLVALKEKHQVSGQRCPGLHFAPQLPAHTQ